MDRFVIVYMDDILIYSKNEQDHLQHLRTVLQILRRNQLYASPSKCAFLRSSVTFLGHTISAEGLEMDPEKIRTILEWPLPSTTDELRSFLGLASYYRKFIPNHGSIAACLYDLTAAKNVHDKKGHFKNIALRGRPVLGRHCSNGRL